ncbi:MAG: DUF4124 domain-containing protein [Halioglobus sp.]|nr:DUF4124 domain-containing protein [Halioglobus sp.]
MLRKVFVRWCSGGRSACLVLSLLTPLLGIADSSIYRTVDADGNVIFTDAPPANPDSQSERVDVRRTNTAPPPPTALRPAEAATPEPTDPSKASWTVRITAPANETTIPMGPGNFSVSAAVTPALGAGQRLQLLMDGGPHGDPRQDGAWQLTNVFRGEHKLAVSVVDKSGKALATSEPVTVYVMRPVRIRAPAPGG